ncbi:DUF4116 domain-containing protein [Acetivibrio ethanolgignens]|uniref:DUF4116 domain-containing protein n=1 Tax=Acetivibrio ethanolgignens TaxID=290052 RepID=A0A0V8QGX0_9FIRM|nr:DUF4116 domain-containing protein [Acetivibrio ethanolgignens]KSV59760.1 hypothetical protein ASU35_17910 [Acetivibrio ethanolgignens]
MTDLEKIRNKPELLKTMESQTEEMILVAVKQDGMLLQYAWFQSDEIVDAAITQNGLALQWVWDQNEAICLKAVKQNWEALQFVQEQTYAMCVRAIDQSCYAIQFVRNQSVSLILRALLKFRKQVGSNPQKWIRYKEFLKPEFRLATPHLAMRKAVAECTDAGTLCMVLLRFPEMEDAITKKWRGNSLEHTLQTLHDACSTT